MSSWLARRALVALLVLGLAPVGWAQDAVPPTAAAIQGSRLITVSGVLTDASGQPRAGSQTLVFSLYAGQAGGEALWQERQVVAPDAQGRYSVWLGVTVPGGVPPDAFGDGKAQWLGVAVEGEAEQARVLLVAVPYALRAADADTLGGKPIASFVLSRDLDKVVEEKIATTTSTTATGGVGVVPTGGTVAPLGHETDTNTWYGLSAGAAISTGYENAFFGAGAGNHVTSGYDNVFVGHQSGYTNTVGQFNVFLGRWAGYYNSATHENTFVGDRAGFYNVAGYNTFVGSDAGYLNTSGTQNVFIGGRAGGSNVGGSGLTLIGYEAGYATTAGYNTMVGFQAGKATTTGNYNAFFGASAGAVNTTGYSNSFLGSGAGALNTTGYRNAFFGTEAGNQNTTGDSNAFFGRDAGHGNTTGFHNTFVGHTAGSENTVEGGNTFIGSGTKGATGVTNATAIGLLAQVTSSNSLVLGGITGVNGGTDTNVGIGTTAPTARLEVVGDVKVGSLAGVRGTSVADALPVVIDASGKLGTADNSGSFGIGIADPSYPLQVRREGGAGSLAVGIDNVLGAANRDVQLRAVPDASTADAGFAWYYNNASGQHLGLTLNESGHVGIGTTAPTHPLQVRRPGGAGSLAVNIDNVLGAANRDVQLRAVPDNSADPAGFVWYYNNDSGAHAGVTLNEYGYLGLGTMAPGYPLQLASGAYVSLGGVWTNASSRTLKQDIAALPADQALAALAQLTPVTYAYKADPGDQHVGFIAEDVPDLVATPDRQSLSPMDIVATLTKVVQQQQVTIAELTAQNVALSTRLAALEEQVQLLLPHQK